MVQLCRVPARGWPDGALSEAPQEGRCVTRHYLLTVNSARSDSIKSVSTSKKHTQLQLQSRDIVSVQFSCPAVECGSFCPFCATGTFLNDVCGGEPTRKKILQIPLCRVVFLGLAVFAKRPMCCKQTVAAQRLLFSLGGESMGYFPVAHPVT